jgi:hypothetical protein
MPIRPSKLWKDLPVEKRVAVADAFWRDDSTTGGLDPQKLEATVAIARRLNFRPKSVQALAVERRARHLAQMGDVSDLVATRALIAYHLAAQRPMMAAFLDAVGLAHENGVITAEEVPTPDQARLTAGVQAVRAAFPADDVALYLNTLVAIDGDTWGGIDGELQKPDGASHA